MSIEQLGESLLSQAKKKSKKGERRAKIFTGLMLGVQAGNMRLRNRAEKRLNSFVNSNIGIVNQRASQFDNGVTFWKEHNNMLNTYGMGVTDTDWKNAYKQKQYELYKQRELQDVKAGDFNEFKKIIDSKIEDDIVAYDKKLELFKNFKNIGRTETDIKESKKTYIKPVQDKLNKAAKIINTESNVGGFLLNKLGIKGRQSVELQEQNIEGTTLLLPENFDTDELKKDIVSNNKFLSELSDINNKIVYEPMTKEERIKVLGTSSISAQPIASHRTSLNRALSSESEVRAQSTLTEYSFTLNNKDVNIRKLYTMLQNDKQGGQEAATNFVSSILTYSKQAELNFEKQNKEGLVKSAEYFLREGIEKAVSNHFTSNGTPLRNTTLMTGYDLNETVSITFPGQPEPIDTKLGKLEEMFVSNLENKENSLRLLNSLKNSKVQQIYPTFIDNLENMFNNKYLKNNTPEISGALKSIDKAIKF